MKLSPRCLSVFALVSLVSVASAQSDRPPDSLPPGAAVDIRRVTPDAVRLRLTAKDLIGATVYDPTGEKLGEIIDLEIQGALPDALASAYTANEQATHPGGPAGTTSEAESTGAASPGMTPPAPSRIPAAATHTETTAAVFLALRGAGSTGADLISVPASQLTYDLVEQRFQLPMHRADLLALLAPTADTKVATGAGAGSTAPTAAGKQAFVDEAARVERVLEQDPRTASIATGISITSGGAETLLIMGIVNSPEDQAKILDAARRATALDVEDRTYVRTH